MAKKPNIRFAGFEDDWEQRKVGDYLTESREIGNKGDVARKMTVKLWGKGVYEKLEAGSTNTQYFIRHANQFIYSKLDFLNCAFGVVPEELESLETTADVPAFDCVYMNPYFMFYRAIQPSFYIQNGIIANGSRKAKRIHTDTFLEMPISVPCLTEQNKIVGYFQSLDHLITLHQRKCDELKKVKKFMLQKMFPKKGEKNPEIRFDGFTNDWEQRKVGDYLTESREIGNKGDVARKMTVKLWGKGVYEKLEAGSTNTQYFIRHANQFIYSKLDFLNCAFGVVPEELESLETTADVPAFDCVYMNPYFMFYRAIQPSFYIQNGIIANGSRKAKRIHTDTFLEMPISVPCLTEQNKIVGYFQSLDHLITLHQRKCEELKNVKKYMLQNMFAKGE